MSQPAPSTSVVPDVTKLDQAQAISALTQAGLAAGTIRRRNDPPRADTVLEQTVTAGTTVAAGTAVGITVGVKLTAPTLRTPPNSVLKILTGKLEWDQADSAVTGWIVNVAPIICVQTATTNTCSPAQIMVARVDQKSYIPPLRPGRLNIGNAAVNVTGQLQWSVAAVDDFGNAGPSSPFLAAQMVL